LRLLARLRSLEFLTLLAVLAVLSSCSLVLLWPMLRDFSTYGFHDWDVHTAYRYIVPLSWLRYGEGPWWHPYLCGGVPAWGYVEGASNFISPYLPLYLLLDVRAALRLEVLGNLALGLSGSYLLARLYTPSRALAAFFAALFFLNGRWAFQAAVGHTWHLQYALLPWVFLGFERARSPEQTHPVGGYAPACWAGAAIAYTCYAGGIYPLPHMALFLGLYAVLIALFTRNLRPLKVLLLTGSVAVGLAAPKLFAAFDYLARAPRTIDSTETIGLGALWVMLTDAQQRYGLRSAPIPAYNWHEWGIYIGAVGVAALLLGLLLARGVAGQAHRALGALCLMLGFGAFHPLSPWTLLHRVPPFSSQHVPSRFHYVMLFFLGLALVSAVTPWLERGLQRFKWLDLALLVPVLGFALNLATVNRVPFEQAFWMRAPEPLLPREPFEHRSNAPVNYLRRDWAAPMLLSMFANTGVVRCYGVDPSIQIGVRAADRRDYRGPAYIVEGHGLAQLVEWTPNRAVIRIENASPGALLVYNMNYDSSWSANGAPAIPYLAAVATRLRGGNETVEFAYFPRTLKYSTPIFVLTLLLLFGASARGRRMWQRLGRFRSSA